MTHDTPRPDPRRRNADGSIGRIVSVTGAKAIVLLDGGQPHGAPTGVESPEMGTLIAIDTGGTISLGLVTALSVPVPAHNSAEPELWIAELGLVGELAPSESGEGLAFYRGVRSYPALGDRVRVATHEELGLAFATADDSKVRIGTIHQDSSIPAVVHTDDLLGKHFAILGSTGTGKSCTTALILRAILEKNPEAHIVLLDPHNEYSTSFGRLAEVITPHDLHLPFWLLTFEELVEVLLHDHKGRKAEVEILQELIPIAKAKYASGRSNGGGASLKRGPEGSRFTVDTPVPYRISDLMAMIDDRMGRLENKHDLSPYKQIRSRIEMITQDPRYAFMFGHLTVHDQMAAVLGRLFRVPVDGKPITILELTGLPAEIVNVVVSVLCRLTFDFALWTKGEIPVTLVCEEAHRYAPSNTEAGFEPAKRAIARIAKEGRKYGASLCIVTQRPSEIDPTIISQCNTVFALRMSNDRDQEIVRSAISDTGTGLLEFLPALGAREAIAFGDGFTLPVRIKFSVLPQWALPKSSTAAFSERWQTCTGDAAFLESVVAQWRASGAEVDARAPGGSEAAPVEAPSVEAAPVAAPGRLRKNGLRPGGAEPAGQQAAAPLRRDGALAGKTQPPPPVKPRPRLRRESVLAMRESLTRNARN